MADTLNQNQQLAVGQRLTSSNGRVELVMQGDGNLVLYRRVFGHPLWASNTNGRPVTHAIMQTDGNFVAYAANNAPFWATGTDGHPGSRVVLLSGHSNQRSRIPFCFIDSTNRMHGLLTGNPHSTTTGPGRLRSFFTRRDASPVRMACCHRLQISASSFVALAGLISSRTNLKYPSAS